MIVCPVKSDGQAVDVKVVNKVEKQKEYNRAGFNKNKTKQNQDDAFLAWNARGINSAEIDFGGKSRKEALSS